MSAPPPLITPPDWASVPFALTVLAPVSVSVFVAIESVCVPAAPPRVSEVTVAFVSKVTV